MHALCGRLRRRDISGVVRRGDGGSASYDLHRHRLQHSHHPAVGLARQRAARARKLAAQKAGERVAEVARAESVDERVDGRVAVAEPEKDVEYNRRRAVATKRSGEVDGEERSPAHDETADDVLSSVSADDQGQDHNELQMMSRKVDGVGRP